MSDSRPPENDPDQDLARRIGEALEQGRPLDASTSDAPLFRALLAYRDGIRAEQAPNADVRGRLWEAIARETRPTADRAPQQRAAMHRLRPRVAWAVAASVAFVAVVAWLWLGRPAAPMLVAEAGDVRVTYTTADGSVVTLRPHSRLFRLDEQASRFRLEGEGYFAVAPDPQRVFAVEAGAGVVRVLGTEFMLSTWGAQTEVYLVEGRVVFERMQMGASVVLAPGQSSTLTADRAPRQPTTASADAYLDWLRDEIRFDQQPLSRIAGEIGHHYGVTLDVPASVQGETLSGTIPLDSLAQSLQDLGQVMGGRFVATGPSTYRFESE